MCSRVSVHLISMPVKKINEQLAGMKTKRKKEKYVTHRDNWSDRDRSHEASAQRKRHE